MATAECGFGDVPGGASGASLLTFYGPTLRVNVGFDGKWTPHSQEVPLPAVSNIAALVDTGASASCIDNILASQLNLPIVDRSHIAGAGGKHMTNIYLAQVHVPSLNFTIHGAFAGVDLKAGGQEHQGLIGRTFLQHFTMTYQGKTGAVVLSSD